MDDILAKHLAKKLLFKENKNSVIQKQNKKSNFYNYKLIEGKYDINTEKGLIISEKIGIWKNKDVVTVNQNNFVVMESSNTMIPLNHLSKEEFESNFVSAEKIKKKPIIIESNQTFSQASKKEEKISKPSIKVEKEKKYEPIKEIEVPTKKEEPKFIQKVKEPEEVSTQKYVDDIKTSTNSKNIEEDAEEDAETKSFFDLLEKKKDDPRVKKFFNYHADHMKKEFSQIIEKFKTTQLARAMESGGGTNAVQYANGGTMNGTLTVTEQIVGELVTDTSGRQLVYKRSFNIIGNGTDNEFTFTHNFNTKDILISVYDSNNYGLVTISSVNIDDNNTRISFPNILNIGENYRVILMA
jgi:hypothetical protein